VKRIHAATAFILICLSIAGVCRAEDDYLTQYIKSVSMFTPLAQNSARELMELGKPVPAPLPSAFDPYSYISHGQLEVPQGVRVMIFAPHPDDEAISASGLIQRVLEKEGAVNVVYVTNGDAYKEALRLKIRNVRISAKDFIEYGKVRQEEGVQALCELGLKPESATFLGFPDDGIDDLWESYWSNLKPFISPHTLFDRPHRKGINRWVKYSGVGLDLEISRVISEFSPDWVVIPDPRDIHPDHATAGIFVLAALQGLFEEGKSPFTTTKVLTYLVHYKDYPWGGSWAKQIGVTGVGQCQSSGKTLSNTDWVTLPLSAEEIEGKRRAMSAHASQLQMLQWFFRSFLLPSELYGTLSMTQVITLPQEYAAHFKHPANPEEPENDTAIAH